MTGAEPCSPCCLWLAGPREALLHAIIRRNYGANYFIVGRDHASPGRDSNDRPFYGASDAQKLFAEYAAEIGVKPIVFEEMVYLPDEARYEEASKAAGKKTFSLSGTEVREDYLHRGRALPAWFTRPEVAAVLQQAHPPRDRQGFCLWFTGLSGAGKSTTADALVIKLLEHGRQMTVLDGDVVRTHLKQNSEWARGVSDLRDSWNGNTLNFSVSIQGVKLSGTISVADDSLKIDVQLPLIAMPFRSWMQNILRNALKLRPTVNNYSSVEPAVPIVLFLHIPKVGGTTLGDFIFNQCRAVEDYDEGLLKSGVLFLSHGFIRESDSSIPQQVQKTLGQADLRAVIGHFEFGIHEHINRPWTYVTLLRNPVERVVSLYHYLKLADQMSIEQFALSPPLKEVDNDQTRRIAGVNPGIGACTNADLLAAQENLRQHFAVVGVTERFDETLILLKRKLNWTKAVFSYPKNVNPNKPMTNSLSPKIIEAIRKRNQLDFELYDYAARLMDETIAAQSADFYDELEQHRAMNSNV